MEIGNISHNENTTNYMKKVINSISNKRIKNELGSFYAYSLGIKDRYFIKLLKTSKYLSKYELIDVCIDNNNTINATFVLKINDYKTTIVSLKFGNKCMYPWKPPYVKIFNTHEYLSLLQIDPNFLSKVKANVSCLCCSSVVCHNNWGVGKKMCDVLDEIYENFNIKSRQMDHVLCKKITRDIFGTYLPIIEFL